MNGGKKLACTLVALALMSTATYAAAARDPLVLPTVGNTFAAPYEAVWDATLQSLGVVKLLVADKGQGRIETEPFPFKVDFGDQVIWVSFAITVAADGAERTNLQVEPRVHDALLAGNMPGPTENPWRDLFARIGDRLGRRA